MTIETFFKVGAKLTIETNDYETEDVTFSDMNPYGLLVNSTDEDEQPVVVFIPWHTITEIQQQS